MKFTVNFKDSKNPSSELLGGKGASLCEMTNAGIPVPPGFVILTSTFEEFIAGSSLDQAIEAELKKVNPNSNDDLEIASKHIRQLVEKLPVPSDIISEIEESYKNLGAEFVAVRSSATSEDSKDAAWAGQLESYLNTSQKTLIQNIKKCWASLYSPRAIFYRHEKNLLDKQISVAVVVQAMVQSEVSGIAFSTHPVTNDNNEIVIESSYGLGEAIVSGQVTPDNFIVKKQPLAVVYETIHPKIRCMMRTERGATDWQDVAANKINAPSLTQNQVLQLARLIIKVENHYRYPCDIEWALFNQDFYILQARPITTLHSTSQKAPNIVDKFLSELGSEPLSVFEGEFLPILIVVDWLNYFSDGDELANIYPIIYTKNGSQAKFYASEYRYKNVARKLVADFLTKEVSISVLSEKYQHCSHAISKLYDSYHSSGAKDERKLLDYLESAHNMLKEAVAHTLFLDTLDRKIIESAVEDNNKQINLNKVWECANILSFKSFETVQLEEIIEVLSKDFPIARLMHVYTNYTYVPDLQNLREITKKVEVKNIHTEIAERSKKLESNKLKKIELQKKLTAQEIHILEFVDWSAWLRDNRKILINKCDAMIFDATRELYKLWGFDAHLVGDSLIFEVLKGRDYVSTRLPLIKARQDATVILQYSKAEYKEDPQALPEVALLETRIHQTAKASSDEILGETASPGQATGKVRIVLTKNQFSDFKDGEILVTSMTRPEFVPLMKKAKAIITDEGGITSHAAIISRELGIPCVTGTKIASKLLKNGEVVQVDADNGIIKRTVEQL